MEIQHTALAADLIHKNIISHDAYDLAKELSIWEHAYTQLSAGIFNGILDEISLNSSVIFKESLNQSVLQKGAVDSETITFGFIPEFEGNAYFNGELYDKPVLLAIRPDEEFEFRSPLNHEIYAANINLHDFNRYVMRAEQRDIASLFHHLKAVSYDKDIANKLVCAFHYANYLSKHKLSEQQTHLAIKEIEEQLFQFLIDFMFKEESFNAAKVNPNRLRIFHQTDAFIREHAKEPIDIVMLCEVSNTSRRTLQYCFETVTGLGPLAYLRCVKLSGVRKEIKTEKEKSITDIATDWGFWHLSHFAAHYKQMFGELPSRTPHD